MRIKISYPIPQKERLLRLRMIEFFKWPFAISAYICLILNAFVTGGRAWSVIVLWSLWIVWSNLISPALVEYNRISRFIKIISDACVLLILIDLLLSPGWAAEVAPIVCFSALMVAGVLFFTDFERQRQNFMPLLLLIIFSLGASVAGLIFLSVERSWPLVVMGAVALALLVMCIFAPGMRFIWELKKRFHTR